MVSDSGWTMGLAGRAPQQSRAHPLERDRLGMLGIHADFAGSGSVRAVTSRFRRSITGWVPLYHAVVVAHPRHLQPTPFLQDPVPHHYPHDMEDIEEIFWRAAEVEPQIKGI